ncbi:hypothetical protein Tco_0223633 [Tanacetum coccineum]
MERDCQHGLYKAGMGSSRVLSDFAEKYGSKNRVLAGFGIGGKSGKEKEYHIEYRNIRSGITLAGPSIPSPNPSSSSKIVTPPKMRVAAEVCPGELLHNTQR